MRGVGVELVWAGTERRASVRRGDPVVRVIGSPGELLLALFGRRDAAQVEIVGPAEAVALVQRAHLGM